MKYYKGDFVYKVVNRCWFVLQKDGTWKWKGVESDDGSYRNFFISEPLVELSEADAMLEIL